MAKRAQVNLLFCLFTLTSAFSGGSSGSFVLLRGRLARADGLGVIGQVQEGTKFHFYRHSNEFSVEGNILCRKQTVLLGEDGEFKLHLIPNSRVQNGENSGDIGHFELVPYSIQHVDSEGPEEIIMNEVAIEEGILVPADCSDSTDSGLSSNEGNNDTTGKCEGMSVFQMKRNTELADDSSDTGTLHYNPNSRLTLLVVDYLLAGESVKESVLPGFKHLIDEIARKEEKKGHHDVKSGVGDGLGKGLSLPKYKLTFTSLQVITEAELEQKKGRFIYSMSYDQEAVAFVSTGNWRQLFTIDGSEYYRIGADFYQRGAEDGDQFEKIPHWTSNGRGAKNPIHLYNGNELIDKIPDSEGFVIECLKSHNSTTAFNVDSAANNGDAGGKGCVTWKAIPSVSSKGGGEEDKKTTKQEKDETRTGARGVDSVEDQLTATNNNHPARNPMTVTSSNRVALLANQVRDIGSIRGSLENRAIDTGSNRNSEGSPANQKIIANRGESSPEDQDRDTNNTDNGRGSLESQKVTATTENGGGSSENRSG